MGQWGTVQVGVPDSIADLAQIIEGFARALLAILNIALQILQIIKAFLVGFLNPLLAIIEAIINEIEAFLNDIRQLGIYISGDLNPEWPFDELIGGFAAYERRMVGRLTNRTDPTRPNFSSRSAVIAVFLYVSVDVTALATIIVLIHRIMKFFGQNGSIRQFTTPVGLEATYGTQGQSITKFGAVKPPFVTDGSVQDRALIRWSMAPPAKSSPINWPLPAPFGFLIEVSVVPDGLLLAWEAVARNQEPEDGGVQTRTFGFVSDNDGRPFRLYGGFDQIDTGATDLFESALAGTKQKPGAARLVAMRDVNDAVPIPLATLKDGNKYLLQRTFFVQTGGIAALRTIGQGFTFQLDLEDMPWNADFELNNGRVTATATEQATTAYVRVAAVSKNVTSHDTYRWTITESEITSAGQANRLVKVKVNGTELNYQDRGPPSAPLTITFPSASTSAYLDAVTAALLVMVLSRSDMALGDPEGLTAEKQAELDDLNGQIDALNIDIQAIDAVAAPFEPTGNLLELKESKQDELFKVQQKRNRLITQSDGTARQETGLEDLARFLVPMIVGRNPSKYFKRVRTSPLKARRDLLRRCRNAANRLYDLTGNMGLSIEELVVERGAPLIGDNAFKWSDYDINLPDSTILESVDTNTLLGASTCSGVGLNPFALGMDPDDLEVMYRTTGTGITRLPGFWEDTDASFEFVAGEGSGDLSPVIFKRSGLLVSDVYFCRNVWYQFPDVYTSAALVLAIAAGPLTLSNDGGWIAIRLLPQGLPPIESMLDTILQWVETIKAGIKSIVDVILRYIEFVEARILEIQAIIVRILGLLDQLLSLQVPAASGLVVVANGTDGILSELITAENKPSDSPAAYGGGVVLLSGGLNTALLSLLQAFFAES